MQLGPHCRGVAASGPVEVKKLTGGEVEVVISPGERHLSPGAVSRYPAMPVVGFGHGLLSSQCLIAYDLLRKLLVILGSSRHQPLGCPTERFLQISWWRQKPPEHECSELKPTSHFCPGSSDPKGLTESPAPLIMISPLQPHNGPHCCVSQTPQGSAPSSFHWGPCS